MIIINDTLGTYGGSITLIERLCRWAVFKNEKIKIYCNDISNKEIVDKLNALGLEIDCFDTYSTKELKQHIDKDLEIEDIQILNFITNNYLSVEKVKYLYGMDFVNLIYSIHPATFFKGTGINNKFLKDLVIRRYKNTIQKMNSNNDIIFMDEDTIEKTETYYSLKLDKTPIIQALPMIYNSLSKEELEKKFKNSFDNKTIFTSCRADFPFKGYLFGLIDDYADLYKNHKDIKLEIVCSGDSEDVNRVRSKIESLGDECKKNIKFHSWMSYQDLLILIGKSFLYVGMGTGVLDAAISYVPSIPVKYNTYEDIADCLIYEKPNYLMYEGYGEDKAINVIEKVLNYSFEEYVDISNKCYEETKKIYDIDEFFKKIKSVKKSKSYLSFNDVLIHSINTFLNKHKNIKEYDVNNIEYESEK